MRKGEINRILKTGLMKKKILLLFNSRAEEMYGEKRFLSEAEDRTIDLSMKKKEDFDFYNQLANVLYRFPRFISILQQVTLSQVNIISNLACYLMLKRTYGQTEEMVNITLNAVPENKREHVLKQLKEFSIFGGKAETDNEGYFFINMEKEKYSLTAIINSWRKGSRRNIAEFKGAVKAGREYLEENEADIRIFKQILDDEETNMRFPASPFLLYQVSAAYFGPHIGKLQNKYRIMDDYSTIEADQETYEMVKDRTLCKD